MMNMFPFRYAAAALMSTSVVSSAVADGGSFDGEIRPGDSTVPHGRKEAGPFTVVPNPMEYLRERIHATVAPRILLKKAHGDTVWGPFDVHVYDNDEVTEDDDICGWHFAAECGADKVCLRLQPVDVEGFLKHPTSPKGSKMHVGDHNECEAVIEVEQTKGEAQTVVDMEFLEWWDTFNATLQSHVGMQGLDAVSGMFHHEINEDFMWQIIEVENPTTPEPSSHSTPAPSTTMSPVPTSSPATSEPAPTDKKAPFTAVPSSNSWTDVPTAEPLSDTKGSAAASDALVITGVVIGLCALIGFAVLLVRRSTTRKDARRSVSNKKFHQERWDDAVAVEMPMIEEGAPLDMLEPSEESGAEPMPDGSTAPTRTFEPLAALSPVDPLALELSGSNSDDL